MLSCIFQYASNEDWKSPLRIGSTCKQWQAAITEIPEAWRLDKLNLIPADHVDTWIRRSGNHRTFTLIVPPTVTQQWINQVKPHLERVDRLVLNAHHQLLAETFPKLTIMEISDHYLGSTPSPPRNFPGSISPLLYPSLQALNDYSQIGCTELADDQVIPIPLINLVLKCKDLLHWRNLLVKFSSIVFFTLTIIPYVPLATTEPAISFPNLVALNLSADSLCIPLSAPRLSFLRLASWNTTVLSAVDVSHVTSLVYDKRFPDHHNTYRRPDNLHHTFPATERILVHCEKRGRVSDLLHFLSHDPQYNTKLSEVFISSRVLPMIPDKLIRACLAVGITVRPTEDTFTLEDCWRASHAPHQ
jgi:hypothetical protein